MKKVIKRIFQIALLVALFFGIKYCWQAFPIISGYGAKNLCSCYFLSNRSQSDIEKNELGKFPLSLGSFTVNAEDSSVTGSVFGLAKHKAIYRNGLGCTLLNDITEEEFRSGKINFAIEHANLNDSMDLLQEIKDGDTLLKFIDEKKLKESIQFAFEDDTRTPVRRTRGVIIIYKGKIIGEQYAHGFTKDTRHAAWSMSKSITNALIGILVKQGKLNINEPAPIKEWENDNRKNITINDLLHASSGLEWEEKYTGPSDATNMLYRDKNMADQAIESPLIDVPGSVFYYSSGTTNILSRIIRQAIGDPEYYRFPYQELFNKIGMHSAVLEPDAGGTFTGSSYCFATLRDYARFGLLYLNDGIYNNVRILPEGWVQYSRTPTPGAKRGEYGAQFWLNAGEKENPANRMYPDVPSDCFYADGFEGQSIWIIPSKDLVVARIAQQQGFPLDENKFLSDIIKSLPADN